MKTHIISFFLLLGLCISFGIKANSPSVVVDPLIIWPKDFMISIDPLANLADAIHPSNLVQPFQKPIVTGPCQSGYGISWSDQIIDFEGCKKILRTWQVLDWCPIVPVIYTHVQVIKVIVLTGPIEPCNP